MAHHHLFHHDYLLHHLQLNTHRHLQPPKLYSCAPLLLFLSLRIFLVALYLLHFNKTCSVSLSWHFSHWPVLCFPGSCIFEFNPAWSCQALVERTRMQTHRQDREKNNLLFTLKEENLKKKKKTSLQRKHRSKGKSRVNMKANNQNKLVRLKEAEPIYTPKHTKDNQAKGKPLGNKQQLKLISVNETGEVKLNTRHKKQRIPW